ncbi:MAG TPA: hypothetical protein VMH86_05860 [Rhizomicrobium sp.]|nr:hypothetical protein [Rhizomicrobium sp.]
MKPILWATILPGLFALTLAATSAQAGLFGSSSSPSSDACSGSAGDTIIAARTDQVDLYADPQATRKVQTLDKSKFPTCTPITGRWPNAMLQVSVGGTKYWVEPHMVKYRLAKGAQPVCRNLAMGTNEVKAGATRGLGEGCPKTGGSH